MLSASSVRSSDRRRLGIETGLSYDTDRHADGLVAILIDATGPNAIYPLTQERLFGWHASLLPTGYSGMEKITVGAWREGAIDVVSGEGEKQIVHYSGPDAGRVPGEMTHFLDWFNAPAGKDELIVKAALAHLWFVTIYPFDDGNGRITRALSDLLLARSDHLPGRFYSVSSQIARDKAEYYALLTATQRGTMEVTEWVVWFLDCLCRAIDNSQDTLAYVLHKAAFWRAWRHISLNARQTKMLNHLLDEKQNGLLTAERWSRATRVSRATALRDLNALVVCGMLKERGGGRSSHYTLSDAP